MNHQAILSAFDQISTFKILVIGDVILDAYYSGKVDRISPEAPVSILDIQSKDYRLGGAANVALNIQGLGAKPILCSVIGNDLSGKRILDLMNTADLDITGISASASRVTSVKTRLISNNHQLMRMDEEQTNPIDSADESRLLTSILDLIKNESPNAIIFEDYDKGVINATLIERVITTARKAAIPVSVDPKKRNFLSYAGATLFKPNLKELRDGLNQQDLGTDAESLTNAFNFLCEIMPIETAFFTLSGKGVFITNGSQSHAIPAQIRNIADVSGAGDTVISTATCALAAGLDMEEIAFISNLAGGWVCQFPGVVAINAQSLKEEFTKNIGLK
jgi:D-glycero-beta-D-manno-heptose-7-phosphate kinase